MHGFHAHPGRVTGQHIGNGPADEAFNRCAAQFRAGRVVGDVAPLDVELEQQVRHSVQDGGGAGIGRTQGMQRLLAAQQVLHPVAQQRPVDRFGNEVGGARQVGIFDGLDIVKAGHHDDWKQRVGLRTQQGADLVAGHVGHVNIEHDHVKRVGLEGAQPGFAALRQGHVETRLAQRGPHQHARCGVVIDDQDFCRSGCHAKSIKSSFSCDTARRCSRCVCASRARASSILDSRPSLSSSR